jgi:DNA polymerase-3 subunit epsilon
MVAKAPPVTTVLKKALKLIGDHPLVAHNAAFDSRFWQAEVERLPKAPASRFACTMLLARRLYPNAPNHKLGTLVTLHRLPVARAHRALADVEMTYHLWRHMDQDVRKRFGGHALTFDLMVALQKAKRNGLDAAVAKHLAPSKTSKAKSPARRAKSV